VAVVHDGVTLLQLNVEGLTKMKINVLTHLVQAHAVTAIRLQKARYKDRSHLKIPEMKINVLTHLVQAHAVTAIRLQKARYKDRSHLKIPGHTLATCTESELYGTATFVKHHAN